MGQDNSRTAMELAEELFGDAKPIPSSASGKESRPVDAEPEIEVIKTGWKAFLYFLIPGLFKGSDKIFQMLPYLFTLLVLILVSLRRKPEDQPPASLGKAYFREER